MLKSFDLLLSQADSTEQEREAIAALLADAVYDLGSLSALLEVFKKNVDAEIATITDFAQKHDIAEYTSSGVPNIFKIPTFQASDKLFAVSMGKLGYDSITSECRRISNRVVGLEQDFIAVTLKHLHNQSITDEGNTNEQ